jgi:subtilisin family serine protease
VRALEADGIALAVQPNYWAFLNQHTAETVGMRPIEQYALAKLRVPQAHGLATGNKVLIAVIDSGIDTGHPELAGMIVDSFDAIGSGNPIHPHGTAIAGAIVAQARLKGTAPAARILAVRAFAAQRSDSRGTTYNILKGLDWAVARGARIVNMSFTGARDPAVLRKLAIARGKGIVLIAAAGNAGPNAKPLFPAADPNVIAVTATDEDDNLFHSANRGPHIAVAAPGVDLLLPAPGGEYQSTSGTSFAAAEVSGTVALMLERNPDLDPEAVRRALVATARDLGPRGPDPLFGAGLVDAYAAVLAAAPAMAAPAAVALPIAATQ